MALLIVLVGVGKLDDPHDLLEHLGHVLLGHGAALHVLDGPDLAGHAVAVDGADEVGLEDVVVVVLLLAVVPEVDLEAEEEDGDVRGVVLDLGVPLLLDVVERVKVGDGEAEQEDVGLHFCSRLKFGEKRQEISS